MSDAFTITAEVSSVVLQDHRGDVTFAVRNDLPRALEARAIVVPDSGAPNAWFALDGPEPRFFQPDETHRYTVRIGVPPTTRPGTYSFHLVQVGVEVPDEDFARGPSVTFQVPEPPPTARRRIPWTVPAAVAAVVLVAAIAFVSTRAQGSAPVADFALEPQQLVFLRSPFLPGRFPFRDLSGDPLELGGRSLSEPLLGDFTTLLGPVSRSVVAHNRGTAPLTLRAEIGAGAPQYAVTRDDCAAAGSVAPGQSCAVEVSLWFGAFGQGRLDVRASGSDLVRSAVLIPSR